MMGAMDITVYEAGWCEGAPAGWPRPVVDGLPLPWITQVWPEEPRWRAIDRTRVLACQLGWLCQHCGLALEPVAYIVLVTGRMVLSNAALHRRCLTAAASLCPHLAGSDDYETTQVSRSDIHAADKPLPQALDDYGEEILTWTVPNP